VILPFTRDEDGELSASEGIEASSAESARRRAAAMVGVKTTVGAVAFSRSGDPALGDFEDAVVLGAYGEVPDDLRASTSSAGGPPS
jgi:predicted Fe-Mo cluster-binding NifX family protein